MPGNSDRIVDDVDVGEAVPIKQHASSVPSQMEGGEGGSALYVIEPADGAWSSPVVLAAKEGMPDHFWKVNFRKVSHVTNSDASPYFGWKTALTKWVGLST